MYKIIFLLPLVLLFSCQKNDAPNEIVRIVPGKSLMEQVAPAMKRSKTSKKKVLLVQNSLSSDQINEQLKIINQENKKEHETLYISGKKAKDKQTQKENMKNRIDLNKVRQ